MKFLGCLVLLFLASGCATMVNGTHQNVAVDSQPRGARVRVDCGGLRSEAVTPAVVTLQRAAEHCSLTLSKSGYAEQTVIFERQRSRATRINRVPGVVAGVVLSTIGFIVEYDGGLAGGAEAGWEVGNAVGTMPAEAVDARTGGAYKQVPERVAVRLDPLP